MPLDIAIFYFILTVCIMYLNEYIPSKTPCLQNKQMTLYKILYRLQAPQQAKTINCLNIVTALQPEDQFPKLLPCRQYSPIHGSLNIKMKTKLFDWSDEISIIESVVLRGVIHLHNKYKLRTCFLPKRTGSNVRIFHNLP